MALDFPCGRSRQFRKKPHMLRPFVGRQFFLSQGSDRTSMERILYAVFSYENLRQGVATPFLAVTQNS